MDTAAGEDGQSPPGRAVRPRRHRSSHQQLCRRIAVRYVTIAVTLLAAAAVTVTVDRGPRTIQLHLAPADTGPADPTGP